MASSSTAQAARRVMMLVGGLAAASLVPAPAAAQHAVDVRPASLSRVRAGDASAAALLRGGLSRSATFRAIVATIERSDLIVYVGTGSIRLPGQLQLLAATPGCRHLRVTIRRPGLDTEMVAWLAHELWHAVEVAQAPEVTDQASLLAFYKRIGYGGSWDGTVESVKAQDIWTTVLREARAAGRSASAAR